MKIFLSMAAGVAFAEVFGYWLHILLHSNKIEWLSKSHMQHHLREYHPSKPIRLQGVYLSSAATRANFLGVGLEWLAPIGLMVAAVHGIMSLFSAPPALQISFTGAAAAWSWVLFAYMHDAMHLKGFWMERSRLFKRWYFKIRRYHDIHHYTFNDAGRMTANFGICFFFFDRFFGTMVLEQEKLNRKGLAAAENLYSFIHR